MAPMRVAFVAAGRIDPAGGEHIVPAFQPLVERQARRHEVIVHALEPGETGDQCAALVERATRGKAIDIVHAYGAGPGSVATLAARTLRVPSVVTLDAGEFVAMPDIGYGLQARWRSRRDVLSTMQRATRLTVCSRYQQGLARIPGGHPEVIPLGVDTGFFRPASQAAAPETALPSRSFRLLHVGRLNAVNDQATLIEAFRLLLHREPQARLDIAGDDDLSGSTQALAHRLGVGPHVTFHGSQDRAQLLALYQRADLFVLSPRHEASGIAVMEAAACGVATVGTAVGYVVELAPYAAVAVPPCEPSALAGAIAETLMGGRKRARIAAAARAWAAAHDAAWTAGQFDRVYQELAAAGR